MCAIDKNFLTKLQSPRFLVWLESRRTHTGYRMNTTTTGEQRAKQSTAHHIHPFAGAVIFAGRHTTMLRFRSGRMRLTTQIRIDEAAAAGKVPIQWRRLKTTHP